MEQNEYAWSELLPSSCNCKDAFLQDFPIV